MLALDSIVSIVIISIVIILTDFHILLLIYIKDSLLDTQHLILSRTDNQMIPEHDT